MTVKSMSTVPPGIGSMAVVSAIERLAAGDQAGRRRQAVLQPLEGQPARDARGFSGPDRKRRRAERSMVVRMMHSLVGETDLTYRIPCSSAINSR